MVGVCVIGASVLSKRAHSVSARPVTVSWRATRALGEDFGGLGGSATGIFGSDAIAELDDVFSRSARTTYRRDIEYE